MYTATIRKNDLGEFVVRFRHNNKHIPEMDYYTSDMEDARKTRDLELKKLRANISLAVAV